MDDVTLPRAPDPAAVPSPPGRSVAYTDLDRGRVLAERGGVAVHEVRVDGVTAALAEAAPRARLSARALVEAVETWRAVADLDGAAGVVAGGKKPRPWVVAERPPLSLGHGASSDDQPDPPLALDHALWTGTYLADTLATAHDRDVVHGALTPTTVRCWPAPGETWPLPRIGDWGIGRARLEAGEAEGETPAVAAVGVAADRTTPPDAAFRAPELASGWSVEVTGAADVYGLGALLYWLLTGEVGHDGTPGPGDQVIPPTTIEPTLPAAVDDPLRAALAVDPAERPAVRDLRSVLLDALRAETGGESSGESGAGSAERDDAADHDDLPSAFPLFDGSRANWRAPCPACGRSVNNTVSSFVDHWVDADRCPGPPSAPPASLAGLSVPEYGQVLARVESLREERDDADGGLGDHPLVAALADDGTTVLSVGGVDVHRDDGDFPWLDHPGRGWRVPCPDCGETVFNALAAFRSHWADAPDCDGPPDGFRTR